MYYPYLRGMRHELLALRTVAPRLAASGKVVPILEPVRGDVRDLATAAEALLTEGVTVAVVTNPTVGDVVATDLLDRPELAALRQAYPDQFLPAYVVLSSTGAAAIRAFAAKYTAGRVVVVHWESPAAAPAVQAALAPLGGRAAHVFFDGQTGQAYRAALGAGGADSVLLRDGFKRRAKNADYPAEEFFGDLHRTYEDAGHDGFGDFATVGATFSDKGGPAYAVTLHLTYARPDGIWVRHFVSDRTENTVDPAGKFGEALAKLVAFVDQRPSPAPRTDAVAALRELHRQQHYPGLGKAKELAVQHHLELMLSVV